MLGSSPASHHHHHPIFLLLQHHYIFSTNRPIETIPSLVTDLLSGTWQWLVFSPLVVIGLSDLYSTFRTSNQTLARTEAKQEHKEVQVQTINSQLCLA